MTDTLWSDISEFQTPVTNAYPYRFLTIRSNDGNHRDTNFAQNIGWCRSAVDGGKLFGFMVYYFYRPGVNGASILQSMVGAPHPKMTVMIDVEGAGGQVSGNQSAQINAEHDQLAQWLGAASKVVGYGNTGDLNALWPTKPSGLRLVIAAYGSNPGYPGKYAHQFSDNAPVQPFGTSDFNSADNMSESDLIAMYGIGSAPPPLPPPPPPPPLKPPPFPYPATDYLGKPSPDPHCHSGHYGGVDHTIVYGWQKQMQHRGWAITTDGDYGDQSFGICESFQREKRLTVDGKVGPQTWQASWIAPVT